MTDLIKAWDAGRKDFELNKRIVGGSFEEACFNQNRPNQLIVTSDTEVGIAACEKWGLTHEEWAHKLGFAYEAIKDADARVEAWKSN